MNREVQIKGTLVVVLAALISIQNAHAITGWAMVDAAVAALVAWRAFLDQSITRSKGETP